MGKVVKAWFGSERFLACQITIIRVIVHSTNHIYLKLLVCFREIEIEGHESGGHGLTHGSVKPCYEIWLEWVAHDDG